MSSPRLNYFALAPEAANALSQLSYVAGASLDERMKELVNLRISQINGCAFCIDMHWASLMKQGMDPRHINAVAGWREAARFFSDAERAALEWAEAVNAMPQRLTDNAVFAHLQQHFTDAAIAELTFTIAAIRSWNLLNASFHTPIPEKPYAGG